MIYTVDLEKAEIDADGGRLLVRLGGERRATLPLKRLERLILIASVQITTRCLSALAEAGIGCLSLGGRYGQWPVHILQHRGDAQKRIAQVGLAKNECARAIFARRIVQLKLRGHLKMLEKGPQNITVKSARNQIAAVISKVTTQNLALESLRGVEGAAAASFFEAYATLLPKRLAFNGRNRRPPKDPVNACLSLSYTLAYGDALAACATHGLDADMPGYHDFAPSRAALACDAIEPARAVVDAWILRRFTSGEQGTEDFSLENGGCLLRKPARDKFYQAWADVARQKIRQAIDQGIALYLDQLKQQSQAR